MKTRIFFQEAIYCFLLFFLIVPELSAGWKKMEVLEYSFDIDGTPRYQQYPVVKYNDIDNDFMCLYSVTGPARDDCTPGDEDECTEDYMSLDGQRVSSTGKPMGNSFLLSPPKATFKMAPSFAHNIFTNEYMLAYIEGLDTGGRGLYIAKIDNGGNFTYGPEILVETSSGAMLPEVIFNPLDREYLVIINDRDVFNEYLNNVGYILDESGNLITGPFPIGNQLGDFYAARGAHNPTNNTYLVVWEDFRHATDWLATICEVYGALLDNEGNMIVEIPIIDDYGLPEEADQRVPRPVYNPDRNEFLVVWRDHRLTLDDGGIIGRFIGPNGIPKGPDFVVADPPRVQSSPEPIYVQEEKSYFITWHDTQNDTEPAGTPWWFSDNLDVYGRWIDKTGNPIGDEVPLCVDEGWQLSPTLSYNPVMQQFLVVWYDRNAHDDYPAAADQPNTPFATAPSEVRGTLYGMPSCLSIHAVEEGTGNPVKGAIVLMIGPSLPALKQTNVGGWCNIEERDQAAGNYLVVMFKLGYNLTIQPIDYAGEPLSLTIEMKKWW